MKRNLTLAIEEELLTRARVAAARHNCTLTALIRGYLERLAKEDHDRLSSLRQLRKLMKSKPLEVGPVRWTREDLHGR